MKTNRILALALLSLSTLNPQLSTLFAQGTAFTYQGRLNDAGSPATGRYSLVFRPFNVPTGGSPLAFPNLRFVAVSNGLFTTSIDFGPVIFNGDPLWLQIEAGTNGFEDATILTPRQPLTPAPYAIFAANVAPLGPANLDVDRFNTTFWRTRGNSNTTAAHFIGTTDDQAFEIRVNNVRVMRYRPDTSGYEAPTLIGGSPLNFVPVGVIGATIAGGGGSGFFDEPLPNRVTASHGTVGGGWDNASSGDTATVGGGRYNTSSGSAATVGGGSFNTASGDEATLGGGYSNTASGDNATVAGGLGNDASGLCATVAGGCRNDARGDASFAAGNDAHANHERAFVWGDGSASTGSSSNNSVTMRASGGFRFFTGDTAVGARLATGETSWSSISDRNVKKNARPVDAVSVLNKLAALPITQWNYQWEADTTTPHLGPMAQDFKAAFYPGRDDKSISTLEFDGVALAAIQGLNEKLEQKETEITELKQRLTKLEKLITNLNSKETDP